MRQTPTICPRPKVSKSGSLPILEIPTTNSERPHYTLYMQLSQCPHWCINDAQYYAIYVVLPLNIPNSVALQCICICNRLHLTYDIIVLRECFVGLLTHSLSPSSEVWSTLFAVLKSTFFERVNRCGLPELKNWGVPFAEVAARFAILPVSKNFCSLPLSLIVKVYGYTIASFLLSERLLNESNYEELASALTNSFEDSAKGIDSCRLESKTVVICKGIANFINSYIKMNGGKGWKLIMCSTDQYGLKAVIDGSH
ncbi:uncharacterized protein TNCV_2831151 [Trichonephila clavipes]|nr:uncharacterized protein TNCV_2831151 [Trichonephila clavipes]